MTRGSWGMWLAAAALAACGRGGDARFPTGSQTVVASQDGEVVYAVNPDEGTLSRVSTLSGDVDTVAVGAFPARVARIDHRLYVTLQGEAGIAVVDDTDGELTVVDVARTGAEPVGVVASADGKRIYVAVTLDDEVEERDAESLEVLRTFAVQDQPTWLALHPNGKVLFVGSAMGATVTQIDLRTGETSEVEVPETSRDNGDEQVTLTPRVTGDPTVTPDGETLAAPTLYVDDTTPVDDPPPEGEPVTSGYGSSGMGVSRLNPALVTWDLDASGTVDPDSAKAIFLGVQTGNNGTTATSTAGEGSGLPAFRSMPTSATARPDSDGWVVTLEGSDVVLAVSRAPFSGQGKEPGAFGDQATIVIEPESDCAGEPCETAPFVPPSAAGFYDRPVVAVQTDRGPRGVAFVGTHDAFVHAAIDRRVATVSLVEADQELRGVAKQQFGARLLSAYGSFQVEESALSPEAERGRALFHSAIDSRMAAAGAGVSCSTCHFQGRSDGIVWTFADGPRNTMTLAGGASETAPFTWVGGVPSVAEEARLTSQGRMGGSDIDEQDLADIAAYVETIRPVVGPADDRVAQGKALFERADVGCATCHVGATGTDNLEHLVLDIPVQTPTLRGVAATPPYFHDGSARTLRDVLSYSNVAIMGDTSSLTDAELDALEAYLRSL